MNRSLCDDGFGNDAVWHGEFNMLRIVENLSYFLFGHVLGEEPPDVHYDLC